MTLTAKEQAARAICAACGENPDHQGDAQGSQFRWQDYLPAAEAAINAVGAGGALVKITPRNEGYESAHPQMITEDALGAGVRGWPDGFDVDVLNVSE